MADNDSVPGPKRRRIPGVQMQRRMISVTPAELRALEARAEQSNTSVSELLVTSVLSPKGAISDQENKALMATLMDTRKVLCELVNEVKNDDRTETLERVLANTERTSTAIFNAIEKLVR